jgi:hypothetical protein
VNKVILLTKASKGAKGNSTPEDEREKQMERVLKEWGVNKGLWLTEMRIKQKIDKIQDLKYVSTSSTSVSSGPNISTAATTSE